jgi:hypothetical protein
MKCNLDSPLKESESDSTFQGVLFFRLLTFFLFIVPWLSHNYLNNTIPTRECLRTYSICFPWNVKYLLKIKLLPQFTKCIHGINFREKKNDLNRESIHVHVSPRTPRSPDKIYLKRIACFTNAIRMTILKGWSDHKKIICKDFSS